MARDSDAKVRSLAAAMEGHCKSAGLNDKDYAKAILRIKVRGFGADLGGLKLTAGADAGLKEEAIALALDSFKKAQRHFMSPDRDGDTYEGGDVREMEIAVNSLNSIG
jgi:hypothetical protein